MGTATHTNAWNPSTSAGFIACAQPISTDQQAVNTSILTKTADTGQINFAGTFTPTVNTAAGYEIYQFNDGLSTIVYKIEYGWGAVTTWFSMWITVGTGSNGSGTITGTVIQPRTQIFTANAASSLTANFPSYMCCTTGAFWMLLGSLSNAGTMACVGTWGFVRSCDTNGTTTAVAIEFFGTTSSSVMTFACTTLTTTVRIQVIIGSICLIPYAITTTNYGTGGNNIFQTFRHELPTPQVVTSALIASYVTSEAGAATTTVYAIVGATTHTFFFCGINLTGAAVGNPSASLVLVYE